MTHARVENGKVVVMADGRWQSDTPRAWLEWLAAVSSPLPSTQQRAREIRSALDEIGYLQ